MRLFSWKFKNFVSGLSALALAVAIGLGVYVTNACKLRAIDGERVFYLDSASSQGLRKEELSLRDFSRITGESVRFARGEETAESLALRIAQQYNAEVLFTEEAGGVISYYCYTSEWEEGILVNGRLVNLHVAVSEIQCAVGTPIIFDGF